MNGDRTSLNQHEERGSGFWAGLLSMAVMVAVLVLVLMGANWLPGVMDKGLLMQYPDIESARRAIGLKKIYMPSFFPENVSWPASRILAQSTPHQVFLAEFQSVATGAPLLVVSQSASPETSPFEALRMSEVHERSSLNIRGRRAELVTGGCGHERQCSMLSWQEGSNHIRLLMADKPFTLLHMAESMVGDTPPPDNNPNTLPSSPVRR